MAKNSTSKEEREFVEFIRQGYVYQVLNGYLSNFLDEDSRNLNLIVSGDLSPRTNFSDIYVSLIPDFLTDPYTQIDWMLALKVITCHEAQHNNSSDSTHMKAVSDWYGTYLHDNYTLNAHIGRYLGPQFLNIIEDGRIERIAVERRPGMLQPFLWLNTVIRKGTEISHVAENVSEELQHFTSQVLSYAKTGLYAPGIEVYQNARMEREFLSIKNIIDDGINSPSSAGCFQNVIKMLEKLSPYFADLLNKDSRLMDLLENAEWEQEYEGEGDKNQSNQQRPVDGDEKKLRKETDAHKGEGNDAGKSEENSSGFGNLENQQGSECDEKQLEQLRKLIEKEVKISAQKEQAESNASKNSSSLRTKELEEIYQAYGQRSCGFQESFPSLTNERLPNEYMTQALRLRRDLQRILKEKRSNRNGLRKGILDTKSLWKTSLHDDRIFRKRDRPDNGDLAIYLLIDNSSSMNSKASAEENVSKSTAARIAAAILEEALREIAPCKISLFSYSKFVCTETLHRFDERGKRNCCFNSLKTTHPKGRNCDSFNIRVATKELLKRKEKLKTLVILCDGEPSAYSDKRTAEEEVRQAVREARRYGIILVPILFGSEEFRAKKISQYQHMYEKDIISTDPLNVTAQFSRLLRKLILHS